MNTSNKAIKMARQGHAEIWPLNTLTVPPYTTTNTVFYGEKNFILIDPATTDPKHQAVLFTRIKERLELNHQFSGIYLTHHHGDHIGCAELVSQSFGVSIWAHHRAVGQVPFEIHHILENNAQISLGPRSTVTSIHTPGHADSHVVFYDATQEALVAGDMITDRGTILIPPGSGSLKIYLESLSKLAKLKLALIIPAHGNAITEKPQAFLRHAMAHRYQRLNAILECLEGSSSGLDATDLTLAVYHHSVSDSQMPFAQLSVESSLQWLLDSGLARQIDAVWHAQPNHQARQDLIANCLN